MLSTVTMISGVTREGADRPGNTLKGVKPEGKIFLWLHLQRIVLFVSRLQQAQYEKQRFT